jgi:hypothetical protein
LKILLPFPTTYECEVLLSSLLQIKTKHRSWLNVEDDLRCALSSTSPRIKKLAVEKQAQPSIRWVFNFYIVTLSVFNKKIIAKSD